MRAIIRYIGVAIVIKIIELKSISKFWVEVCTLKERLLSKSSWSFVVRARILPVGVTSNQPRGVFNKTFISYLWIILDVLIMNLPKNIPLRSSKIPTLTDIIE